MLANTFSTLFLRSYKKNILATGNNAAYKVDSIFEISLGFLEINDVDTISSHEDIVLHARVPSFLLVAEMYASLQQVLD